MTPSKGRKRVVITHVNPQVAHGQYPAKAVINEEIAITADVFCDGHDKVSASVLVRHEVDRNWQEYPMTPLPNDRWTCAFVADRTGYYSFQIQGWVDHFQSWKLGLEQKMEAGADITTDLKIGATLIGSAADRAKGKFKKLLGAMSDRLIDADPETLPQLLEDEELRKALRAGIEKEFITVYPVTFRIRVARKKAGFSTWYELFPRSAAAEAGRHGSFNDVRRLLPRIADMGFDTLYLPPIHPIGRTHRKGKNNSLSATEQDPGSPWAIGDTSGGHKSIHPALGTLKDFKRLVTDAAKTGIEIAMDIAFQCSPDHPYIQKHPQWFRWRPDGTIQYAENPPKKYEDIVPFDFDTDDWSNLWQELKTVFQYWIAQGIHIFRVDNPHTKPFAFWEWVIAEIHAEHPEVIFLAEAFTRPRVMELLAQCGFTQSYTYFTWRHSKYELETYIKELIHSETRYYFRPNFWPNTPDILTADLAHGGDNSHIIRLILAATLSSNYGLYGPVYELGMATQAPGKEEYADNEKYEIHHWDWDQKTRTSAVIRLVNNIRRANRALQTTWNTLFLETTNDQLIGYAKTDPHANNYLLVFVNLDPHHTQSAHVRIPLQQLGLPPGIQYQVTDLLSGDRYQWSDEWNFVQLNPDDMPAHILSIDTTPSHNTAS